MNTKTYLNQIAKIDTIIKNRRIEIERFKELAQSITVSTDKERVQTSGTSDIVGDNVVAFVNEEKELEKDEMELLRVRREIITQLEEIPDQLLYDLLFLKYVSRKTMEEIAYEVGYTSRGAKKALARALIKFEEIHGEKYLTKSINPRYYSMK